MSLAPSPAGAGGCRRSIRCLRPPNLKPQTFRHIVRYFRLPPCAILPSVLSSMSLLEIRLLGEFSAVDHRGNTLSVGNKRTQALVIYLALKIGGRPTLHQAGELICGGPDSE